MRILILFILSISNLLTCSLGDSETQFHLLQVSIADSLYKSYLPQHNFEEVKAAVDFFELEIDETDDILLIYNCARAHYYHAVGLTERDDIIGACEHYLRALELMETNFVTQNLSDLDYDKTRFMALIYTRLGRLFFNENYCDLAIIKYNKALKYVELMNDTHAEANILKGLANAYHLSGEADSALYYYNKSLRSDPDLHNRLDVEKSIAKILFDKGEKDSAYVLITNNLDKMEDYSARNSYYLTLGEMYYKDKVYENAITYLDKSIKSTNVHTIISSALKLSCIYDSVKEYDKKAYYDNIISRLSIEEINNVVEDSRISYLYSDYKERKYEREKSRNREHYVYVSFLIIVVTIVILIIFSIFRNRKRNMKVLNILNDKQNVIEQISKEIEQKEENIKSLEFRYSLINGKMKSKDIKLQEQGEMISRYKLELAKLENKLKKSITGFSNLNGYYQSEICSKILIHIKELSESNKKETELKKLMQNEFALLLKSANYYLNNIFNNLTNKYPNLKKEDLYYMCLVILNLNDRQISSLFGVTYNSIKIRRRKICSIFNIKTNEINIFLEDII